MNATQPRRPRWFNESWEPLDHTATYGASDQWKRRAADGQHALGVPDREALYVTTIDGSPFNDRAPEDEVEDLLGRSEPARSAMHMRGWAADE